MTERHRPHILVIDDALPVLDLYGEILRTEGYQVSLTAHADVGIHEIKRAKADLIILDLVFHGETLGVPLIQAVKQDTDTTHIPVVVSTGAVRVMDAVENDLARQGVAMIRKPFDIEDLLAMVRGGLTQSGPARVAHP